MKGFKGDNCSFGLAGVLDKIGEFAAEFGNTATVEVNRANCFKSVVEPDVESLRRREIARTGGRIIRGTAPNAPREGVYRITTYTLHFKPDYLIAVRGGSTIDAVKAANVLASLGEYKPEIEPYFGIRQVSAALAKTGWRLLPMVAVESAASSSAHLTKYSNVTGTVARQKKLIVGDAVGLVDYCSRHGDALLRVAKRRGEVND